MVIEAVVRTLGHYVRQGGDLEELERLTAEVHAPDADAFRLTLVGTFGHKEGEVVTRAEAEAAESLISGLAIALTQNAELAIHLSSWALDWP